MEVGRKLQPYRKKDGNSRCIRRGRRGLPFVGLCEVRRLHPTDKMTVYLVLSSVVIVESLSVKFKFDHGTLMNHVPAQTGAYAHLSALVTKLPRAPVAS